MAGIITIDGSQGEGGGQVLRSSLALSLVTGRPSVIEKIRAGRKKPGLLQQHLTAVLAATEVSGAEVEGAALGSRRVVFRPGPVRSGDYAFRVGTAGSATLVLQTVLPALLLAEGESNLVLEGGTHNPMAPPVDFLENAYLPLVNRLGPRVELQLVRPGFYPAGGGKFTVRIQPTKQLGRLELVDRGQITARRVRAMVANLPRHIAERECRTIAQQPGWDEALFTIDAVKGSRGPGNAVIIELEAEHVVQDLAAGHRTVIRVPLPHHEDCFNNSLSVRGHERAAGTEVPRAALQRLLDAVERTTCVPSPGGVLVELPEPTIQHHEYYCGCEEDFRDLTECRREWTQGQIFTLLDWLPLDAVAARQRLAQMAKSLGWRSFFQGWFWYAGAGISGLVFARWATIAKLDRFRARREAVESLKLLAGIFFLAVFVWIVVSALSEGHGPGVFHFR